VVVVFGDFVVVGYQGELGQTYEQAVFYYSGDVIQLSSQALGIADLAELAIQNVIAFIGDEGLAVGIFA
jgi:hypothetical protein